jgi:hypothetical protein
VLSPTLQRRMVDRKSGGGGIRTHETPHGALRFSRPPLSTARPPRLRIILRALAALPATANSCEPAGVAYASVVAPRIRWASLALTCCLVFTFAAAGCGGSKTPSQALQREVAGRFAVALFRGDVRAARALLVRRDEGALVFLVERAAAPWRGQHASVSLPARPTDDRWAVSYEGTRTHADGRFESESGDLIVLVATSSRGAGVRFFGFTHVRTRFSTHHDSELLPSKR